MLTSIKAAIGRMPAPNVRPGRTSSWVDWTAFITWLLVADALLTLLCIKTAW